MEKKKKVVLFQKKIKLILSAVMDLQTKKKVMRKKKRKNMNKKNF
jgi:hypothetical protein